MRTRRARVVPAKPIRGVAFSSRRWFEAVVTVDVARLSPPMRVAIENLRQRGLVAPYDSGDIIVDDPVDSTCTPGELEAVYRRLLDLRLKAPPNVYRKED